MNDLTAVSTALSIGDFTVRQVDLVHSDTACQPEELIVRFTNGFSLHILDAGQDCCEERTLTCDDDLEGLAGSRLLTVTVSGVAKEEEDGEEHEMAFVIIQFSTYAITLTTHNRHNGYYGGIAPRAVLKDAEGKQRGIARIPGDDCY